MFDREAYCQRYFMRKEAAFLSSLAKPFKWVGSKMGLAAMDAPAKPVGSVSGWFKSKFGLSSLDNVKPVGNAVENNAGKTVGTTVENKPAVETTTENTVGTTVENKPAENTGTTTQQQPKKEYGALKALWEGTKAVGTLGAGGVVMGVSGGISDH